MIFEQTVDIPENRKLHLDIELPSAMPCGIAYMRLFPNPPETMMLSETSLAKTWDTPAEDKAWENL
jgi:hypothetical protein